MRLGLEVPPAQDESDLLELIFVLGRRGIVPEAAPAHLAQDSRPPLLEQRGDSVGPKARRFRTPLSGWGELDIREARPYPPTRLLIIHRSPQKRRTGAQGL